MVQVIEQDNFGSGLGQALGKGGAGALDILINSRMKRMADREKFQQLQDLLGGSAAEGLANEDNQPGAAQLVALEQMFPGAGKIVQEQQKRSEAKSKEKADKERVSQAVRNMYKVLPSVGPGKIGNKLTASGRKQRQYFDSLAMNLEEIAATMVGKGVLSKPRFEFLLKNLPSSKKTQASNEGALKAWSETLNIDITPNMTEETVKVKEELPGGELTETVAMNFLRKARGDKDKARKLARKAGYEF